MKTHWMVAGAMLALSANLYAHEEPIESTWCEGGRVVLLGKFTLHGNQISRYADHVEETGECPGSGDVVTKSCGQFDDMYAKARGAASNLCHQFVYRTGNGDDGTVRPIFYEPASFSNKDPNHHKLYRLEQGVVFACGLCEMPEIVDSRQLELAK
ncbi:hypothetical protein MJ923_10160 [Shewanella sp. 3B26]|uniref:DUF2147 domain-containing protein n=1 Tax=Shewanella zhuhaiensis TaxID=2919576 RepID=A0AAJ1BIR5_9GAMM|nr:hypothetical protein [Shewanella zhuhaiensis]MCH4294662.1 hypothetical protein [Shewanella zhuhaiensis]